MHITVKQWCIWSRQALCVMHVDQINYDVFDQDWICALCMSNQVTYAYKCENKWCMWSRQKNDVFHQDKKMM